MLGIVPLYNTNANLFGLIVPSSAAGSWIATSYNGRTSVQVVLPDQSDAVLWPLQKRGQGDAEFWIKLGLKGQEEDAAESCRLDPSVGPQMNGVRFIHVELSGGRVRLAESADVYPENAGNVRSRYFTVPFTESETGQRTFGSALDATNSDREIAKVSLELASMRTAGVAWDRNLRSRIEQVEQVIDPHSGFTSRTQPPELSFPTLTLDVSKDALAGLHFVLIRRPMEGTLDEAEMESWPLVDLAVVESPSAAYGAAKPTAKRSSDVFGGNFDDMLGSFPRPGRKEGDAQEFERLPWDRPILKTTPDEGTVLFFAGIGIMDVFGICSTDTGPWLEGSASHSPERRQSMFFRYLYPNFPKMPAEPYPVPQRFPDSIYKSARDDYEASNLLRAIMDCIYGAKAYSCDTITGLRASALAMGGEDLPNDTYQMQNKAPIAILAEGLERLDTTRQHDLALLPAKKQARLIALRLKDLISFGPLCELGFEETILELSDTEIKGLREILKDENLVPVLELVDHDIDTVQNLLKYRYQIEKCLLDVSDDLRQLRREQTLILDTREDRRAFLDDCVEYLSATTTETATGALPDGLSLKNEKIRNYVSHLLGSQQDEASALADVLAAFNTLLPGCGDGGARKVLECTILFEAAFEPRAAEVRHLFEPNWLAFAQSGAWITAAKIEMHEETVSTALDGLRSELLTLGDDEALRGHTDILLEALQKLKRHQSWIVHRLIWQDVNRQVESSFDPVYEEEFERFTLLRSGPPHIWPEIAQQYFEAVGSSVSAA